MVWRINECANANYITYRIFTTLNGQYHYLLSTEKNSWEKGGKSTVRKGPIGSTNHQWGSFFIGFYYAE
ncbi:hypothetical protein WMO63_10740 [Niallia sp. CLA-SR-H024]|uniref:Uncharacterized protein n=1 Tax=Niallia hominis TaxID=3133173 RepID=A0ABV1EYG9_9BACI|nr:hypothetical protein [Bacillus sp. T2.9-1]